MIVFRILGHIWTLPNTLIGLFVGICLTFGLPRRAAGRGFLVFASGRGVSKRVVRAGPWATTLGAVVIFWNPKVKDDESYLLHEGYHVLQYLCMGPFFIPVYLAFLPFTGWQEKHPLELPAYRAADPAGRLRKR